MESDRPSRPGSGEGTQAVTSGPDTRAAGPFEGAAGANSAGPAGQLTFGQADAGQGTSAAATAPVLPGDGQGAGDSQPGGEG